MWNEMKKKVTSTVEFDIFNTQNKICNIYVLFFNLNILLIFIFKRIEKRKRKKEMYLYLHNIKK